MISIICPNGRSLEMRLGTMIGTGRRARHDVAHLLITGLGMGRGMRKIGARETGVEAAESTGTEVGIATDLRKRGMARIERESETRTMIR